MWDHPLTGKKWQDIVEQTQYMTPQVQVILSGANGPIHTQKYLALITLGEPTAPSPPSAILWKPTFFEGGLGKVLAIDVPSCHRWKIYRLLPDMRIPELAVVDAPRPSIGSTRQEERAVIYAHFSDAVGHTLQQEMICKWIAQQLLPFRGIVEWTEIISNKDAMLVDVPTPAAILRHSSLCTNQVVVGPKTVLVSTYSDAAAWRAQLASAWNEDPMQAGERVRARLSRGGRAHLCPGGCHCGAIISS